MTVWKNAVMETYFGGNESKNECECQVRIDGSSIVISYEDEDGKVIYVGEEVAAGHFKLRCPERRARATLHRAPPPDDEYLEGHWVEEGYEGMWRIFLDSDD